jgi:predicted 3-demethylubiquinone-9 3-methyltransferase (glyoxalase superfamily)
MVIAFELDGVELIALNGGPIFKFNEAVSLSIGCQSQAEVDHYWNKLTAGGTESQCGWLKDKYGVSWQVVPLPLTELMASSDAPRVKRMTEAMFKMKKLDIAVLEKAFNG